VTRYGLDLHGAAQEPVASCFEHGNEPPFSIKRREFLDQLGDYKPLNEDTDLYVGYSMTMDL